MFVNIFFNIIAPLHINDIESEHHALNTLMSQEEFKALEHGNRNFKKLFLDVPTIHLPAYNDGFRIEPVNFGGFCLKNRSGKILPTGELQNTVGLMAKKPKNRTVDDWCLMEGEKLMIGIARWANHSFEPNCDYYMSGYYNGLVCVRLRALRPIVDGEVLVTFYNRNFFGYNNADCLCGMEKLHGNQNVSSDEAIKETVREISKKRCRKSKPRISLKPIVTPKLHLEEMIKFYEDCSKMKFKGNWSLKVIVSLNLHPSIYLKK